MGLMKYLKKFNESSAPNDDKESSEKGIPFDVAGEGDGIYIFSNHLTADEKRQLTDYLKYRR